MLGTDLFALAGACRVGGQDENPASAVGEPLEHRHSHRFRFTLGGERLADTATRETGSVWAAEVTAVRRGDCHRVRTDSTS